MQPINCRNDSICLSQVGFRNNWRESPQENLPNGWHKRHRPETNKFFIVIGKLHGLFFSITGLTDLSYDGNKVYRSARPLNNLSDYFTRTSRVIRTPHVFLMPSKSLEKENFFAILFSFISGEKVTWLTGSKLLLTMTHQKYKERLIPEQNKTLIAGICLCQLTVVLSLVSFMYLSVAIYIPSHRAFTSGFDNSPVVCQTVERTMINNCAWASCGEWCLTKTTGYCPQIHVIVRRNGTDLMMENCTKMSTYACLQVSGNGQVVAVEQKNYSPLISILAVNLNHRLTSCFDFKQPKYQFNQFYLNFSLR